MQTQEPTPSAEPTDEPVVLLFVTDQKDGDSWVASDGKEYRLRLINTPETNEPCGAEATVFTRRFLSSGFTVDAYATDDYGRAVAEVLDDDGRSAPVPLVEPPRKTSAPANNCKSGYSPCLPIVAEFATATAWKAYIEAPAHVTFVTDHVTPLCKFWGAIQLTASAGAAV